MYRYMLESKLAGIALNSVAPRRPGGRISVSSTVHVSVHARKQVGWHCIEFRRLSSSNQIITAYRGGYGQWQRLYNESLSTVNWCVTLVHTNL